MKEESAVYDNQPVSRGFALFLGAFGLLNVLGDIWRPGFDANIWWLDMRLLTPVFARSLTAAACISLIWFGVRPAKSIGSRWIASLSGAVLLLVTLGNSFNFYQLLSCGQISSRVPVPLSVLIAAMLLIVLGGIWDVHFVSRLGLKRRVVMHPLLSTIAIFLACAVLFPLAQMFFFGKTDYRRPADVTVVLGARVYADGRPSDALADRVRTACNLYKSGLTRKLLFSGGPGDGAISEAEAMKRMAVQLGVKPQDILLDTKGLNTEATVRNTKTMFAGLRASRVLVVSHFYHLPRIKLAYQREGMEVYTVPAKESYLLRQMPYNMAREVAALWVYYLRPVVETRNPVRGWPVGAVVLQHCSIAARLNSNAAWAAFRFSGSVACKCRY